MSDWKEGHYTFHFSNNTKFEQYYFDKKFRGLNEYFRKREPTFKKPTSFRKSWCSPKQPPLKVEYGTRTNITQLKPLVWKFSEKQFNEEFRLCLDYHDSDNSHRQAFSNDIACKVAPKIESYNPSGTCSELRFRKYTTSTICDFKWKNKTNSGSLTLEINSKPEEDAKHKQDLKLPQLNISESDFMINLMCFIRDTSQRKMKFVFNQPIIAGFNRENQLEVKPKTINLNTSPPDNKVTLSKSIVNLTVKTRKKAPTSINSMQTSHTSTVVLAIVCALLLAGCVGAFLWRHRKRKKYKLSDMTWEMNELYETDESDTEETNEDTSLLPKWLRVKPDMIYQPWCVDKGQALGYGQYGTVFKGKLNQGNAV